MTVLNIFDWPNEIDICLVLRWQLQKCEGRGGVVFAMN